MKGRVHIWLMIFIMIASSIFGISIIMEENSVVSGAPISVDIENISYNATEDLLFEEVIEPVDITGDSLTWKVIGIPNWLSFQNGTMYGVPGNDHVGWNNFTIEIVTSTDDATLNVSIMVTNSLPQIIEGSVAPMAWEDQEYISRFDLREDGSKWSVSLKMAGPWEATWAQIGRNGTVYGTPRNVHVGNWTLNITLDDGNGGVVWYEYLVTVVNEPPKITVKDYGVVQEWVEKTIDFDCQTEGDGATYYELVNTNIDSGEFDPVSGQFTFIPGKDNRYYGHITVRARDFFGGIDEMRIEFPINNTMPVLISDLPTTFIAGEIAEVDLNSNEEGLGLRYGFHERWPVFTDRMDESRPFDSQGRIRFYPWNIDVGDHNFIIFLWDSIGDLVFYNWNFTVIANSSFMDPTVELSVLDTSNERIQLDIIINENGQKYATFDEFAINYLDIRYPDMHKSESFTTFDPLTERYVELENSNLSGTVNITVYLYFEHIDGSERRLTKTIQVDITTTDPIDDNKQNNFPWWMIIVVVLVLLVLIVSIVLIFIENVSYAVQMAVFKGGTIDEEPIITLVHGRPGIHFRELLSYSNFSRRDLVSTLVAMENNGAVRPIPDGVLVRFYPTVGSFIDGPLALNRDQERIAKVLLDKKKITHQELSDETGISKGKLDRETSLMELKGALSERKGHKGPEYYLSSRQKKLMINWMDSKR